MSFTQITLPGGRRETSCDRCHERSTSQFVEVLRAWARDHICPDRIAAVTRNGGAR